MLVKINVKKKIVPGGINCGKCAIATLAENSESVSEAAAGQRTIFVREC